MEKEIRKSMSTEEGEKLAMGLMNSTEMIPLKDYKEPIKRGTLILCAHEHDGKALERFPRTVWNDLGVDIEIFCYGMGEDNYILDKQPKESSVFYINKEPVIWDYAVSAWICCPIYESEISNPVIAN